MLREEKAFERQIALSETDRIMVKARRVKNQITFLVIVGITTIEGKKH